MNSNRRNKVTLRIGIIVFIVTFLLFFILTKQITTVNLVGLIFIILSETGLFGGLVIVDNMSSKSDGVMLRSGIYGVLTIYSIVSIIISLLFMTIVKDNVKVLIIIQIVVIAVTTILLILITSTSKSVWENNKKTLESVTKIQSITNKVTLLQNDTKYSAYARQLEKIVEALKYCDNATAVATDDILNGKISELELLLLKDSDNKDETVTELGNTILLLIKQRAAEVRKIKAGGI